MNHGEHPYKVRVAPEALANGIIVSVVVAGVLTILVSLLIVRSMIGPARPIPSFLKGQVPDEIARIDQTLIEVDHAFSNQRVEQKERLQSYGWIDPSRGVIHIPIERAFDLFIERHQ